MPRRPPPAPPGGRKEQQLLVLAALARHQWPFVVIHSWDELVAFFRQIGYWSERGTPYTERGLREHITSFGLPPPFTKTRKQMHKPKTLYSNSLMVTAWLMTHRYPHP